MIIDVVVDTNVLQHSYDPRQPRRVAARQFLEGLLAGRTAICVDGGFSLDRAQNRSRIAYEYLANLPFVNPAFQVIVALGRQGRIRQLSTRVDNAARKRICQLLRNTTDRIFVKVTYNSSSRILVSHDFNDFDEGKRCEFRRCLTVHITTADVARNQL